MKRALRIFIFLFAFILVYLYMCLIFTPKNFNDYGGEDYYGGVLYQEEKPNTIDVVAIGNSDLYSSLVTPELYGEYGFTTYNCGSNKQKPKDGYFFLRDINKKHDVKLLIIEADFIYENRPTFSVDKTLGKARFLLSPFVYHAKWKKLKPSDFYKFPEPKQDILKGYRYNDKKVPVKDRNYMVEKPKTKIPQKNIKVFDEMVKYCNKHQIQIICYEAPSLSSWNLTKYRQVKDLCDKYGIPYYDFNEIALRNEIDFKLNEDFRDNGNHCNIKGARKITNYLGNIINEKYDLPNHHNDKSYEDWDKAYEVYKTKFNKEQKNAS